MGALATERRDKVELVRRGIAPLVDRLYLHDNSVDDRPAPLLAELSPAGSEAPG